MARGANWEVHKQRVFAMIRDGMKQGDVAAELGISPGRLSQLFTAWGTSAAEIRHSVWATKENLEKLVYDEGLKPSAIAERVGADIKFVNMYLEQFGIDPWDMARRFWSRVGHVTERGCLPWEGKCHDAGYGFLYDSESGGGVYAHRYAWQIRFGAIPDHLEIAHVCNVRNCVNADHMELVTGSENVRRMHERRKTAGLPRGIIGRSHCPHGHEKTPENVRIVNITDHKRGKIYKTMNCKVCQKERDRKRHAGRSRPKGEVAGS